MINDIIAYENGDLDEEGVLALFAELIRTGSAWRMQGSYGRMAQAMIEGGFITSDGEITGKQL